MLPRAGESQTVNIYGGAGGAGGRGGAQGGAGGAGEGPTVKYDIDVVENFTNNLFIESRAEVGTQVHDIVVVEKLERWLRSPDMTQKQRDTEKLRQDGTGRWFLEGNTFIRWQDNAGSLWIEGPSGAGKSVLSSTVIKELFAKEKLLKDADKPLAPAVAFFYFDFRNKEAQSVEIALRRIVLQLSAQSPDSYRALNNHYELLYGQKLPGYKDLCNILQQLLRELGRTYIVLDALDECDEGDLPQLMNLISMFRNWTETPLHLFITSQTRQIFTEGFRGVPCVALGFYSTRQDIRTFVGTEIRSNPKLEIWRPQVDQITDRVAHKSQGMFRLAACLVIELSYCQWEDQMDETLENLPDTLFAVYDRFIQKIRKKDWVYAETILRWLMFSARRLSLQQVADAIAFDFSNPEKYIYKPSQRQRNASAIFDWLEGLVVKSTYGGDSVAALAHASVQDYLLSREFTVKFGHNLGETLSHTFLSRTCITYLVYLCNHPLDLASGALLMQYPLVEYTARYWYHHLARSHDRSVLSMAAIQLLVDWRKRHDDVHGDLAQQTRPIASTVYFCCRKGYIEGVQGLLTNNPEDRDLVIKDSRALQVASARGHTDIVRLLLQSGANANGQEHGNTSDDIGSKSTMSKSGYIHIVRLLESEVSPPSDSESSSPIELASEGGHMKIVELLLKSGANPNLRSGGCRSTLETASWANNIGIVQLLLEGGANPNLRREQHGSALELALEQGSTGIVHLLLNSGADPNVRSEGCRSALELASFAENIGMVQLLLERGADPNLRSQRHRSALELAVLVSNTRMVQLLLESGADVNGRLHSMALHLASWKNDTDIVRLLLDNGADPHLQSTHCRSVIEAACKAGRTEIVTLLVGKDVDVTTLTLAQAGAYE